jgi:hypothetical protein
MYLIACKDKQKNNMNGQSAKNIFTYAMLYLSSLAMQPNSP